MSDPMTPDIRGINTCMRDMIMHTDTRPGHPNTAKEYWGELDTLYSYDPHLQMGYPNARISSSKAMTTLSQCRVWILLSCICYDMMTSSNDKTFSALLAICAGNSPVPGEFPTQRPVTRSFDVYFDLRLNKRLCKQSWGWWLETLLCPLWRHSNG